jgi:predicted small integral membrane protein
MGMMKIKAQFRVFFRFSRDVATTGLCRLLFLVVGACLTLTATIHLQTFLGESFSSFLDHNFSLLVLLAVGLCLFALGQKWGVGRRPQRQALESPAAHQSNRRWFHCVWAVGLVGVACGGYGYTIWAVIHGTRGLLPVGAFFASLVCLVGSMVVWEFSARRRSWFVDLGLCSRQSGIPFWKRHGFWVIVYLSVWIFLVQINLDSRPGFLHGDEAMIIDYGQQTYMHQDAVQRIAPVWSSGYQPYLSGIPRALLRDLFPGQLNYGARLFSVLMSAGVLGSLFLLGRRYFGVVTAWLALLLCSTSHVYLAFSRLALNNIDALFLACVFLLAFLGAWRSRRPSLGVLGGVDWTVLLYISGCFIGSSFNDPGVLFRVSASTLAGVASMVYLADFRGGVYHGGCPNSSLLP